MNLLELNKLDFSNFDIRTIKWQINTDTGLKLAGGLCAGLTGYYLVKIWKSYSYFRKLGVVTPKPRFIFGNHLEILRKTYSVALRNWTLRLGQKTYGYYEGHQPILVTSDLDIIYEVFVRQNTNFLAKKELPFQYSDEYPSTNIALATRTRWRRMRNIMNTTFSMEKIAELVPLMTSCADNLIHVIETNKNQEISVLDYLNRYTMDLLCICSFGVNLDCLNKPKNQFYSSVLKYFKDLEKFTFVRFLITYFTELRPFLLDLISISTLFMSVFQSLPVFNYFVNSEIWLVKNIDLVIDQRVRNKTARKDLIQVLLQSQADEIERASSFETVLDKKMSLEEMTWNLIGFLQAGFGTTSATLKSCFYILATHPEEQEKLQKEIDNFMLSQDFSADIDIEKLNDLEYLDLFIKETLRMYPIANSSITRRCTHNTVIKDIKIPNDLVISIDVLSLHYDPELYGPDDTNTFVPMRFSSEYKRNPLAYMPFGIGPRNCVGMKFALTQIKLTLIKILSKYDVLSTENTPSKITFNEGIVCKMRENLKLKFQPRK